MYGLAEIAGVCSKIEHLSNIDEITFKLKSQFMYAWFAVFDWAVESVVNQIWIVYRQNSTVVYSLARE